MVMLGWGMDHWFLSDLKDDEKDRWFWSQPKDRQNEEYFKASRKQAKRQAGRDLYAIDPLVGRYIGMSRSLKHQFDLNNNCYAWASGSVLVGAQRLALPNQKRLCPHPGDSLGIPYFVLNGTPSSVFGRLNMIRHLCQFDQLTPLRVGRAEPLPETAADQRLIGIALYKDGKGRDDFHCVVRSAGATYMSHKPGFELPPSMLDYSGRLFSDPRQANLGRPLSRWAFFTAPQAGVTLNFVEAIKPELQALLLDPSRADRQDTIRRLGEIVQQRSPRFARQLLAL